MYNPAIGKFLQVDPLKYYAGMNLYRYVGNNPILLIDPFGLCEELAWVNAIRNYISGTGQDLNVSINEVYPQQGLDFGENNRIGYDTNGPAGRIVFQKLENGNIIALPDRFDFDPRPWGERDPGGFPYPKEVSTRVGTLIPGGPYYIRFNGQISPQR